MQKLNLINLLVLATLYLLGSFGKVRARFNFSPENGICKSVTIRSINDFNKLQHCKVVAGYVQIVHMNFNTSTISQLKSSNIEEISEYLLVYATEDLDSLERLFPKLIVIRGVNLLHDQYALVILENLHMKNIGLVSLLRVLKGSIRVEFNPSLCFARTINWMWILGDSSKKYFYSVQNNKPFAQCPLCYTYIDELTNYHKTCWSVGNFQQRSFDFMDPKMCYKNGEEANCLSEEQNEQTSMEETNEKCPKHKRKENSCLTSCSEHNCRYCVNYVSETGCVANCLPPKYKLAYERQCVTDCAQWGLIEMGLRCVEKCPRHYHQIIKKGVTTCSLNCTGDFEVHRLEDLEGFSACTTIKGSLIIELHEAKKPIIEDLERAFHNLNEITGYIKIVNSPQILSLHFFKNLHTIRGSELIENRYSVYVVDNAHLNELFPANVAILSGCVYFHLNPLLCYEKILDLANNLKKFSNITLKDASRHSNGEAATCEIDNIDNPEEKSIRGLNVTVADINSDSAIIEMEHLNSLYLLMGYVYYYKEATDKNVTRYDGRHGCGWDSWFMDIVVTRRRRHILQNLKPATQYAYFVNSLTYLDDPSRLEYVSEINYFQTLPAKPGVVAKLYSHSLSASEIELHWWPPRVTNGIIEKYILQYELTDATIQYNRTNRKMQEVCQCPKLDIDSTVPVPHASNYYNKEKEQFVTHQLNFLFPRIERLEPIIDTKEEKLDGLIDLQARFKLKEFEEQDEGKETYVISHPLPSCYLLNASVRYRAENNCTPLQRYENATEIPGHRHSFIIRNLEPAKIYRIRLRACVRDLANGCGDEKVILAETVSKRLEKILLESLTFNIN